MENPLKVSLENIIPLTEARDHFSQIVNEVQKDKLYVLTKGGKPAVAIVDVKYLEHITGGEAKVETVEEEIKKAPEKVGLPEMLEHPKEMPASNAPQSDTGGPKPFTPPPRPSTPPPPPPPSPAPKPAETPKPFTPPPTNQPPKPPAPEKETPPPEPVRNVPQSDAGLPKPITPPSPKPEQPKPPAGFAAPNFAKAAENKPTPPPTKPPVPTPPPKPPTPPPPPNPSSQTPQPSSPLKIPKIEEDGGDKIDIQITDDTLSDTEERPKDSKFSSPDDKAPPSQYAGNEEEPEDMSID